MQMQSFPGIKTDDVQSCQIMFLKQTPMTTDMCMCMMPTVFAMQEVASKATRKLILEDGYRVDGRGVTDVRAIWSRAGCLPRAHGSALFTRGETQALAVTTLGMTVDSAASGSGVVNQFSAVLDSIARWSYTQRRQLVGPVSKLHSVAGVCSPVLCLLILHDISGLT